MSQPGQDFSGSTALVTGGGGAIGGAVSRCLAGRGARVVVADRDEVAADRVASEIGGTAIARQLDVTDPAAVEALVTEIERDFGGLHLAVNNVGVGVPQLKTADAPLEDWRFMIEVNLNSVFYCMKYEIAAMLRGGRGAIVNMGSIMSVNASPMASAYSAAKHGVLGLTKTAAAEYAAEGIRINAVGPGYIHTPLTEGHVGKEGLATIAAQHPIGRLGRPEEIAEITAFLLSPSASFITGSFHLADGGYDAV